MLSNYHFLRYKIDKPSYEVFGSSKICMVVFEASTRLNSFSYLPSKLFVTPGAVGHCRSEAGSSELDVPLVTGHDATSTTDTRTARVLSHVFGPL